MISHLSSNPQKVQMIDRINFLKLLEIGLEVKAYRFTRQSALAWLSAYPGDLLVNLFFAKALIKEERADQANQILEKILRTDPEFLDAASFAEEALHNFNPGVSQKAGGLVQALGGAAIYRADLPDWGVNLYLARQSLLKNQYEAAREIILSEIAKENHSELADILHLQLIAATSDIQTTLNLARSYHNRWPECIQISLILAKTWLSAGTEEEGVKLLHYCASMDTLGQVPTRMWGSDFAFKQLYPTKFEIVLNFAIPAEIAGKLGLNQLASGPSTQEPIPAKPIRTGIQSFDGYRINDIGTTKFPEHPKVANEPVKEKSKEFLEAEEELKKVAVNLKQPALTHIDNRFPAYVILTTKTGLEKQYGANNSAVIQDELKKLALSVQVKNGWSSIIFMPDDLEICGKYGITPIDSIDPWKIKLALSDLDKALSKTGERIGCVLIAGGDSIVPFHRLPNPTEDTDIEVPSDSPYAALDTNYFVSDWPVGRLPGESGEDAGLLLTQIRNTIQYHSDEKDSQSWVNQIFRVIFFWNRPWLKHFGNIGYSAAVWRRSSISAFRPIGEAKNLYASPNGKQPAFDPLKLANSPISYFNLHGVEDGSDWYGQRDPLEKDSGPDFPIALSPVELHKNAGSPRIVYSEACYGGHIFGKTEEQSIALSMLGIGVLAMVASTTISYGSVTTPLIGADLIGYLVMKNLRDGLPVGASLAKARVEFVREMNRRQGYLDGEDQKTLISFVLYGDPLVAYDPYQAMKKDIGRDEVHPVVKTLCDRTEFEDTQIGIAPKMIAQAKSLVKDYLPGIEYADIRINNQQVRIPKTISSGLNVNTGGYDPRRPNRVVVSFSKNIIQAERIHHQFARVTMDQQGKMIKLAVSR